MRLHEAVEGAACVGAHDLPLPAAAPCSWGHRRDAQVGDGNAGAWRCKHVSSRSDEGWESGTQWVQMFGRPLRV
eukprot:6448245-Alexandrium_andersonii.AAC.1